jgi:(E)-4-hydroxy-3-methyl-but-2-enyl pyrophosphate reductase
MSYMEVLTAKKLGFCFGVEHAIEAAENLLAQGKKVYCLGPLIHNKHVVDRLAQAGMQVVDKVSEIDSIVDSGDNSDDGEKPTVLIRSHGCRPELLEEVKKRGFNLVDATCVLVRRAQKLVGELFQQGYQVVVVGDPNHPEIQGVVGYAPGVIVVADPNDLDKLPSHGRLAVISQTTYSAEDFGQIVGLIAMRGHEEMKVVNTICRETARRQEAAIELCRQVDIMFVLGSRHSANTRELAQLCQKNNVKTYHLRDWQEFDPAYVTNVQVAGVTAGASTPDWLIKEFVENLQQL